MSARPARDAGQVRLDPLLAFAVPTMWAGAGLFAGSLSHARTAAGLCRRVLLLLAVAALASGAGLFFGTPLVTAASAAALGVAVPRLVRLRRSAVGFATAGSGTPAPPALRAAAAHPAIVVPVQALAYASVAAPLLASGWALALVPALMLALVLTLRGHAVRHRRLAAGGLLPPVQRRGASCT